MNRVLERHRLVRLAESAWHDAIAGASDAEARTCLAHWCDRDWPVVVTRQQDTADDDCVSVGLPAPAVWKRRRFALRVPVASLRSHPPFPGALDALDVLDPVARDSVAGWLSALSTGSTSLRLYGSLGWECMTGLTYRHPDSDLDLLIGVLDAGQADAACDRLVAAPTPLHQRVDGELVFPDGAGVSWRDWQASRGDSAARMVVKRLRSVSLEARASFESAVSV